MICIVAFPNGDMNFKAELLPAGRELDYAIEMLETSLKKLHEQQNNERLKNADAYLRLSNAVPTLSAIEG